MGRAKATQSSELEVKKAEQGPEAKTTEKRPEAETTKKGPQAKTTKKGPQAKTTKNGPQAKTTKNGPQAKTTKKRPEAKTTKKRPEAKTTKEGPKAKTTKKGSKGKTTKQRPRKKHIQMELLTLDGTRAKTKRAANKLSNRGGRPAKGERSSSPHRTRPQFKRHVPLHVVLRVDDVVGNLRRDEIYEAFRKATSVVAPRLDFQIVHLSIQRTHVHLIAEAEDRHALSAGMKAFQISAAKHINRAITPAGQRRRRGRVFTDRYHAEMIESPRQANRAIGYVLNNFRKHRADLEGEARQWLVDKYSTGVLFDGWLERAGRGPWPCPDGYRPLVVKSPRTWFMREGWRNHGLISCLDVPSSPFGRH